MVGNIARQKQTILYLTQLKSRASKSEVIGGEREDKTGQGGGGDNI